MSQMRSLVFVIFAAASLMSLALFGLVMPIFSSWFVSVSTSLSQETGSLTGDWISPDTLGDVGSALWVTFAQALLSASLCVFAALVLGRWQTFLPTRVGRWVSRLALIPFGMPSIIIVFGFILAFGNQGIVNRFLVQIPALFGGQVSESHFPFLYHFWAIVHAHVFFNFGICLRQIVLRYQRIPAEQWWAADLLGLGAWKRVAVVEWPALKHTLVNLWLIVFGLSVTSFSIVLVLGGSPELSTLEVMIYQFMKFEVDTRAALFAALLQVILVGTVTLVSQRFARLEKEAVPGAAHRWVGGSLSLSLSSGRSGWNRLARGAQNVVFAGVLLWLGIPLVALVVEGLRSLDPNSWAFVSGPLWSSFLTSMAIALPVAGLSTAYGLAVAQAAVRWRSKQAWGMHQADRLADVLSISLLALSPTVMGFFLHVSLGALGIRAFDWALIAIIVIQSFLFTPLSFRIFYGALRERVPSWRPQYAALELPLGIQTLIVEWRGLLPQLVGVFMINFSFSVGEVVGPALFGDANFRPLSLLLLELVGSYQFDQAGLVTLIILVLAFVTHTLGSGKNHHARS